MCLLIRLLGSVACLSLYFNFKIKLISYLSSCRSLLYFTALKKLWHEMDLFAVCKWKDPDDGVLYRWMLAKNECMIFSPDSIEQQWMRFVAEF